MFPPIQRYQDTCSKKISCWRAIDRLHVSDSNIQKNKKYENLFEAEKTLTGLRKLKVLPNEQCVNLSLSLICFLLLLTVIGTIINI